MYGNDGERPVRLNGGASTSPVAPSSAFLGVSAAAERVRERIRAAAPLRAPVLITGESGVGKELVTREIHFRSPCGRGVFLTRSCGKTQGGSLCCLTYGVFSFGAGTQT
jgi:transcriptional regulator with AAA-type ATPase domain